MGQSSIKELSIQGKSLGATGGITLLASGSRAAGTVDGATVTDRSFARSTVLVCVCNVTVGAGTTLDVAVEASLDGGTNWFILAKFSQYGAAATGMKLLKVSSTGSATFATEVVPVASPTVSGTAAVNNFAWDTLLRASYVLVGTNGTFSVGVIPTLTP